MAMLRESSTSTAMMFCCGLSSATVMAGCQSRMSTIAASVDCSPQITHARQLRIIGAASASFDQMSHASAAAAATISTTSTHFGHAPSSANWPRAYMERGYRRRSSNMAVGVLRSGCLVGHRIGDVVQHDAERQTGKLLRVFRFVGMLPCVAEMHVVTDGHHDAAVRIANGAPLGHVAVLFI